MKQLLKLLFFMIFGVFTVFGFISAQVNNYPNQTINQNQPFPIIQSEPKPPTVSPEIIPTQTSSEIPPSENTIYQTSVIPSNPFSSYLLYVAIIVVLAAAFFWKRLIELLKRKKGTESVPGEKAELPAEAEKIPCSTCKGTGKITKHQTKSVPCGHCKKTGIDICQHCGGTGRNGLGYGVPLEDIENYPKCDYCGGKGFPETVLSCCMCKGARKETYEEAYEVPCPTCKGSGLVNNY